MLLLLVQELDLVMHLEAVTVRKVLSDITMLTVNRLVVIIVKVSMWKVQSQNWHSVLLVTLLHPEILVLVSTVNQITLSKLLVMHRSKMVLPLTVIMTTLVLQFTSVVPLVRETSELVTRSDTATHLRLPHLPTMVEHLGTELLVF